MDFEEEMKKTKNYAEKNKELTFSKWAFIFMMANCSIIEIFSMIAMVVIMDLSALPSLITAVVGECIITLGYMAKATMENRVGGITYETAIRNNESVG